MTLPAAFLDLVRQRTALDALIGQDLKLEKAGSEHKACCPFHMEKTPSFTVVPDKGFYHCHGCGAHGDAFRWLTDYRRMDFIAAVAELAEAAGLTMPARSPEAAARAARIEGVRPALEAAAALFARELEQTGRAAEYVAGRGLGPDAVARFGLGYAPNRNWLRELGIGDDLAREAGLAAARDDVCAPLFRDRIMFPVHDARGRIIAFGGRAMDDQPPKYVNSPEGPAFDKGQTLWNLHRAAPAVRTANRVVVLEGYMDVIALDQIGLGECVSPMGTALTEAHLVRLWRLHHRPVLLLDGDAAGQRAQVRAAERALPHAAPGQELWIARLEGGDPDEIARRDGPEGGRAAIDAALAGAVPLADFLWQQALELAA